MRIRLLLLLAGCSFRGPGLGGDLTAADGGPADATDATASDSAAIGDATAPVDTPGPIDAALSADAFALVCPGSYAVTIASSTSHYRILTSNAVFSSHATTCNADLPGATHLIALDSTTELTQIFVALAAAVPQPNNSGFYIGAVQQPNQASPSAGWLIFTGAALPGGMWAGGQPDDAGGGESNSEQLGLIDRNGTLQDVAGQTGYGAVCECDGLPIAPAVTAALP